MGAKMGMFWDGVKVTPVMPQEGIALAEKLLRANGWELVAGRWRRELSGATLWLKIDKQFVTLLREYRTFEREIMRAPISALRTKDGRLELDGKRI